MSMTQLGTAEKAATTFRQQIAIRQRIAAPANRIWGLLTNAADFPRWNSTVTSIEGEIALGQKLKLRVPNVERTFTPKVVELEPGRCMVWSDGFAPMFSGKRSFALWEKADGTTDFTMIEVFSGLMLPLIRGSLPDFAPSFEQYARDLKTEAERGAE
jgi:hypothetical protein